MSSVLSSPALPQNSSTRDGVLLFLTAVLMFALYDAFAKHMVARYSPALMNIGRYVTISGLALVLLLRHGDLRFWRHPHQGLLMARSSMLALVSTCFMAALVTMPLAEATAIYFTSPLLVVALAGFTLGEKTKRSQWIAVFTGLAGMLLIVRPGDRLPLGGTLLMALAAIGYALFQILTRRLSGKIPSSVQFAHMAFVCLLAALLLAAASPGFEFPSWQETLLIFLGGLISGFGQLLLLAAFQRAPASTLAPLNYVQLLAAVLISAWWFGTIPDGITVFGMIFIAGAGLYLARSSAARRK